MNKFTFVLIFFVAVNFCVTSDEINFPPELIWWLNKIKSANSAVEIRGFTLHEQKTIRFSAHDLAGHLLAYPVFMRWNYSGNIFAYYCYNYITLKRQNNGKYRIESGDIDSHLVLADRNKKIFFMESFGSMAGIDAYNWLTDTVLVAVGNWGNMLDTVDVFIRIYTINNANRTVEIKIYNYENALTFEDRNRLKLKWFEQRSDYFEEVTHDEYYSE